MPDGDKPSKAERPKTRWYWIVLTALALIGIAFVALGVWALGFGLGGGSWIISAPLALVGFVGFVFVLLLTMGLVYRVDKMRGDLTRRIELFE